MHDLLIAPPPYLEDFEVSVQRAQRRQREQELETMCCNLAKAVGWLSFKGFSRSGGADRIFFREGRCFLVEFKTLTGKVRENQKIEAEAMKKNRTPYFIVRTLEEFKDILISRGEHQ